MTRAFLYLMICFFSLQACKNSELKYGYTRKRKVDSFRQVLDLQKGSLLVMLHSRQNKIDALKSLGKNKEAATLDEKQKQKNKSIIKNFREQFSFCPVYFFMNSQAKDLTEKGSGSVTFLNDSLDPDTSIHFSGTKFLVAEFGNLQADTSKDYSTSNFSFQAFIIESPDFIQLKKPFPNFVMITETDDQVFFCRSVVQKINNKLFAFLDAAKDKILARRFRPYFSDVLKSSY